MTPALRMSLFFFVMFGTVGVHLPYWPVWLSGRGLGPTELGLVMASGFIVRGHGRLQAALRAGLSVAPVDYQDYENEAAEWADLIADNRIAELAETDFTALADLLSSLDTGAFDLDLTGFSEGELKNIMGWTPENVEFKEYDESAAEDVKKVTCPECGHEFPV